MVQVRISDGVLEGELLENKYGGPFYSFKGIPYAEPPIGDLRFKAPVQVKPWDGIRQAKEFSPCCPQYHTFTRTYELGSEDCLYLNVYSPNISPPEPLPVMFWIHGGGLTCGSSDEYEPDFLIRHNVILVTINYRLKLLGFLSLHTEDIPGNAGMKDQVEAMKWVQRNIANFGGNPNNVTIFGESAGAACASFHLISPMTKGLFKRAILQSGSCLNCWSRSTFPRERTKALARNLGLNSEDDKEIYEFLKSQPVETLIDANVPLTYREANKADIQFSIVDEKDFGNNERYYYGDVFKSVNAGIHEGVEVINGYTEHEGTMMTFYLRDYNTNLKEANSFPEFFVPNSISMKCSIPQIFEIGHKVKKFYFKQGNETLDTTRQLINYYSMEMFASGIMLWQNMCAYNNNNKLFMYKFTCKSERKGLVPMKPALGPMTYTSHSDDLAYIFPMRKYNQEIDMDSKSFKMVNEVTKLWTNFAKYGDPTADATQITKWLPYTLENKSYMDIGEQHTLKESPDKKQVEFWTDLFKEFYPSINL